MRDERIHNCSPVYYQQKIVLKKKNRVNFLRTMVLYSTTSNENKVAKLVVAFNGGWGRGGGNTSMLPTSPIGWRRIVCSINTSTSWFLGRKGDCSFAFVLNFSEFPEAGSGVCCCAPSFLARAAFKLAIWHKFPLDEYTNRSLHEHDWD